MKNIKTFNPLNPDDKHYTEDFRDWIYEDFINPLIALGFTFKGNISTNTGDDNGAHVFHFDNTLGNTVTSEQLAFLNSYDEGSNWNYFTHYDRLTFIINWSS